MLPDAIFFIYEESSIDEMVNFGLFKIFIWETNNLL